MHGAGRGFQGVRDRINGAGRLLVTPRSPPVGIEVGQTVVAIRSIASVLTLVMVERARSASGEERTVGASWAHGGGGALAMLWRRRGEHHVERHEAKLGMWSMVAGLHCRRRKWPKNGVRLATEKLQLRRGEREGRAKIFGDG